MKLLDGARGIEVVELDLSIGLMEDIACGAWFSIESEGSSIADAQFMEGVLHG